MNKFSALCAGAILSLGAASADAAVYDISVTGLFAPSNGVAPTFENLTVDFRIDTILLNTTLSANGVFSNRTAFSSTDIPAPGPFSFNSNTQQASLSGSLFALRSDGGPSAGTDGFQVVISGFDNFLAGSAADSIMFQYSQASDAEAFFLSTTEGSRRLVPEDELVTQAPIPAAGILLLTALAGLAFGRRRA